jgi:CDP-diacylglycerol--serine O-phosphatidyltransferase
LANDPRGQGRPRTGRWRIRSIRGGKWWRERGQKSLSMIPHLFTLANLAFGVISIILTHQGNYPFAALAVLGSLIADGLDGRMARLLKADGEFGKELDSLADVVAFGTAPAFLLYEMALKELGLFGLVVTVIFPICGALRLARFNIIKTSGFFLGVPITAAGTYLALLAYYAIHAHREPVLQLYPVVVLLLAYLMISTIPYPDFKKRKQGSALSLLPGVGPLLVAVGVLAAANWNPWIWILIPLTAYISLGPWLLILKQFQPQSSTEAHP